MQIKNGKIVEITDDELFELYLKREMDDIMSFNDYIRAFERVGCKVIETQSSREEV